MTMPTMNTLRSIYPLIIKQYETFIPNIEGMDITQKTNSIIQYLNRIGKLNNDVVADWNKVMTWVMGEGITDAVNSKIDDLITKGTFDDLLQVMFDDINTANTNFQNTINGQVNSLSTSVNNFSTNQGNLSLLNTTDKTSIVNAIKEVKTQANSNTTSINNNTSVIASIGNGSPKGVYATLTSLQSAFPTGTSGIYIVSADGKWYYWSGSAWTAGGVYQSTGLALKSVRGENLNFSRNAISDLTFVVGGMNNGLDATSTNRIRSSNFLHLKSGDTITCLNNLYSFNIFLYSSADVNTYVSTPNSWMQTYTVTQDIYVRVMVRLNTDSTNITNDVNNVPTILNLPVVDVAITDGKMIGNNLISSSHLSSLLKLTSDNLDTSHNNIIDLTFVVGGMNVGLDATSTNRIRSTNFLHLKSGDTITCLNNLYSFNIFLYSSPDVNTYVSTPNSWMQSYAATQDIYARVLVRLNTDSTNIANDVNNVPTILSYITGGGIISKGLMIANGIITTSHLSDSLKQSLPTGIDGKTIDLVMFMGQSNMAGRGITSTTWTEAAPNIISGAGYEFRVITDPTKLYPMAEPFGVNENDSLINDGTMKTGSMVTAFTNAYYKTTKIPIVGVSASQGGQSITTFQNNNDHLTGAINRLNTTVTWLANNGYTIRHKYMVWCQGETDGDNAMSGATYTTYFQTMLNTMLSAGIEKCFLVRIGNYNGAGGQTYTNIINAQTQIAQTNKNVVMVTTDLAGMKARGLMKDDFHYYQAAYNEFGTYAGVNTALYVNSGKEPSMYDTQDGTLYYNHKN
jgi:hypothetical protein